jgi:membrane protein DedA with SNARE-associated domain
VSSLASTLLAWLELYTYPVAALTVLIGALGVPLPTTIVVLGAGAITTDGDPSPVSLFVIVLVAAVIGDVVSFCIARWAGHAAVHRFGARVGLTPSRLAAAEKRFERWGGLLIITTRCLLTGLALPTNLVAGAGEYSLARFVAFAIVGEAIWSGQLVTLGWLYGANWVSLLGYLEDATAALTGLAVAAGLAYALFRLLRPRSR